MNRFTRNVLATISLASNWVRAADLSSVPQIHETREQRDTRMQWFREAKCVAAIVQLVLRLFEVGRTEVAGTAIAEMLIQSHAGKSVQLSGLLKAWATGGIKGL